MRKCTGLSETANYGVSMTTITIVDSLWRHNQNCCYANMRSQGQASWHLNSSVTCGTVVPRRWTCLSVILPYSTILFLKTEVVIYRSLHQRFIMPWTSENSFKNGVWKWSCCLVWYSWTALLNMKKSAKLFVRTSWSYSYNNMRTEYKYIFQIYIENIKILTGDRWQTIIWASVDQVPWCHMAQWVETESKHDSWYIFVRNKKKILNPTCWILSSMRSNSGLGTCDGLSKNCNGSMSERAMELSEKNDPSRHFS